MFFGGDVTFFGDIFLPGTATTLRKMLIFYWFFNVFCDLEGAIFVSFRDFFRFAFCIDFWSLLGPFGVPFWDSLGSLNSSFWVSIF